MIGGYMFDFTFLIPDYGEPENEWEYLPPDPCDVISDREEERLAMELYYLIDIGAFDPENELFE
jgi:hypothetical protein